MAHDTSWKKTDTNSPAYKRQVVIFTAITIVAGLVGGSILAYKIDGAEKARIEKVQNPTTR